MKTPPQPRFDVTQPVVDPTRNTANPEQPQKLDPLEQTALLPEQKPLDQTQTSPSFAPTKAEPDDPLAQTAALEGRPTAALDQTAAIPVAAAGAPHARTVGSPEHATQPSVALREEAVVSEQAMQSVRRVKKRAGGGSAWRAASTGQKLLSVLLAATLVFVAWWTQRDAPLDGAAQTQTITSFEASREGVTEQPKEATLALPPALTEDVQRTQLAQAVDATMAGRYEEALVRYRKLAKEHPEVGAYRDAVEVLRLQTEGQR